MRVFNIIVAAICLLIIGGGIVAFALQHKYRNQIETPQSSQSSYKVTNTWKMPGKLKEISGISWLSDSKIACIEDEDGVIFIYDLNENKIKEEITFGDSGDYEAITINKTDAYVMRSDGVIFEIKNFQDKDLKTSKIETVFSSKNDMESLFYDFKNDQLITVCKYKDLSFENYKGLYAIPLKTKQLNPTPILKLHMKDKALKEFQKKKLYKTFYPSDIAIHPKTEQYYILDGRNTTLMLLSQTGKIEKVIELDEDEFPQPEGLTFSPDGKLYISTEGRKHKAAIMEVEIKK